MAAEPESGSRMVDKMRTAVVFPAPFGPSRPSTVPASTSSDTRSSARTLPRGNTLTRSCASTAGPWPDQPNAKSEELPIGKET